MEKKNDLSRGTSTSDAEVVSVSKHEMYGRFDLFSSENSLWNLDVNKFMQPYRIVNESLRLDEILNIEALQLLMDEFYFLTNIGISIIDKSGNILVSKGWQDICTKFHRIHPDACQNCIDSDKQFASKLHPGEFMQYKCKNSMWDIATQIVFDKIHLI